MRWSCVLAGALSAAATCAGAQAIDDDLCDLSFEGLSLASTPEEIAAKFEPLGWHDLSEADRMQSNGLHVSTIVYDEARTSNDMPPPGFVSQGRFQMVVRDGQAQSVSYSDDGGASAADRAVAFCAMLDDRFEISGCDLRAIEQQRQSVSILAHPKNAGEIDYCQVSYTGGLQYGGWSYGVSRHSAESADTRSGLGRGRGRGL